MTTTHHPISSKSFSAKTLRALSRKGITIISSTFVPDAKGSFCNGESAYLLESGELKTFLQVLALAA